MSRRFFYFGGACRRFVWNDTETSAENHLDPDVPRNSLAHLSACATCPISTVRDEVVLWIAQPKVRKCVQSSSQIDFSVLSALIAAGRPP